jgi:hypothetical protein
MRLVKLSGRAGAWRTSSGSGSLARMMFLVILACLAALLVAGYSGSKTSASGSPQEEEVEPSAARPSIIFILECLRLADRYLDAAPWTQR